MKRGILLKAMSTVMASVVLASTLILPSASAADNNFSLQVTPSPLVATVKPGVPTDLELKVRNSSTGPEQLKIEARSFRFDNTSGEVLINDTATPEIAPWISFSDPIFSLQAGQWFTQKVHVALPKETGFSYSFALLISRKDNPTATTGGHLLKGTVAVFTLINVDRPGATRTLELASLTPDQGLYEYLPTTINVRLKNTGNSIVQPYGNVFIQRGSNDKTALATLPVNQANSYLLPGTERTLQVQWDDGFPVARTTIDDSGKPHKTLEWNFDHLSHFRIGRYTAKIVAVYNDGTRDVPIVADVTFWVIPWKAMLGVLIVLTALVLLIRRYSRYRTAKAVQKALKAQAQVKE